MREVATAPETRWLATRNSFRGVQGKGWRGVRVEDSRGGICLGADPRSASVLAFDMLILSSQP